MDDSTEKTRDAILQALLPDVAFEGWTWDAVRKASLRAGFDAAMADAVFPGCLPDALDHFSDWADRGMLAALQFVPPESLRVRDRIHKAVMERFKILSPWKEAARLAARRRVLPHRMAGMAQVNWRTADRIWIWAGDTATDYNRYTKRTLLAGVIGSATLFWLADRGDDLKATEAFVGRRIENVMQLGRMLGKLRKAG